MRQRGFGHIINGEVPEQEDEDMNTPRGYAGGGQVNPLQNPQVQQRMAAASQKYGPDMVQKAIQAATMYLQQQQARGGQGGPQMPQPGPPQGMPGPMQGRPPMPQQGGALAMARPQMQPQMPMRGGALQMMGRRP